MKKNIVLLAVFSSVFALAAPALAQSTFDGGGGNDLWNNATNWNPDGVPTTASGNLSINNFTVDVDTNAPDFLGTLSVTGSSVLTINADFGHISTATDSDVTFNTTITQNAGDVYWSDDTRTSGAAIHNMNGGTFVNRDYYRFDSPSLLDIRGGSFTIGGASGIGLNVNGGSGTLKVVGDAATLISFGSLTGFGSGSLDMVLKDGGITTIGVGGDANLPGTLDVTLDAGFILPLISTNYDLIDAGSLSGALGTVNLPSADWSVNLSGSKVVLSYTNPVPEPTSLSVLALGGLGMMFKRRRRRA